MSVSSPRCPVVLRSGSQRAGPGLAREATSSTCDSSVSNRAKAATSYTDPDHKSNCTRSAAECGGMDTMILAPSLVSFVPEPTAMMDQRLSMEPPDAFAHFSVVAKATSLLSTVAATRRISRSEGANSRERENIISPWGRSSHGESSTRTPPTVYSSTTRFPFRCSPEKRLLVLSHAGPDAVRKATAPSTFGTLISPKRAASNFRKPPVHAARHERLAVSKQTVPSSRSPTFIESPLATTPPGASTNDARNCPTSVRLQRLSTQSFSSCEPTSRPADRCSPCRSEAGSPERAEVAARTLNDSSWATAWDFRRISIKGRAALKLRRAERVKEGARTAMSARFLALLQIHADQPVRAPVSGGPWIRTVIAPPTSRRVEASA